MGRKQAAAHAPRSRGRRRLMPRSAPGRMEAGGARARRGRPGLLSARPRGLPPVSGGSQRLALAAAAGEAAGEAARPPPRGAAACSSRPAFPGLVSAAAAGPTPVGRTPERNGRAGETGRRGAGRGARACLPTPTREWASPAVEYEVRAHAPGPAAAAPPPPRPGLVPPPAPAARKRPAAAAR
uniref:skin secretory protein xP2-like n=1 Tax=Callithrix jacchus TaxID=9483 RepID=UPI0023DCED4A|nr:skin secretory protein xP2-like [Callithrix jacchus]XP_054092672.1 skin secretory protein xP2-like [Callithrix jacchus]XP_054092673.1 skin secretory protein xP2-like [Callithrix jacchus]XP_054092674.1 skin secretory protein xP2-like [Callithrix jacchus]